VISLRAATAADAEEIARVHVETWKATYAGIVDGAYLASLTGEVRAPKWKTRLDAPPEGYFCLVAMDGDRIVGFVDGGPIRGTHGAHRGEIYALYVLPEMHRRGIGRMLVHAALEQLRDRLPVLVWVLDGNPSLGFYEHIGGVRFGETTIKIGPKTHREIGFAFQG
jgi:GNAT superfamily N-acetyltransferase